MSGRTIVITRPKADALKLADSLKRKGFRCIIEPMLLIHTLHENAKSLEYALDRVPQAILVTSKHAITALSLMTQLRNIPIVAVGQATASRAANLGFENVDFASGTAHALIAHVANKYSPANGPLLYIRGVDVSVDIAAKLMQQDFIVDSITLYQAKPTHKLSDELRNALADGIVDSVLFFSQNTLKTYARLITANSLADAHTHITAICMSRAIADKAKSLLAWKEVILFPRDIKNIL